MIGAPLALAGLIAVAVPVIIHLLGRHQSRVIRFPTLRFISASRLVPTHRKRISDWPLLLVRVGIVALGAIALSQPYFACAGRSGASAPSAISRAIIVDTSASMRRAVAAGAVSSAVDSARHVATALKDGAEMSTTVETADIAGAIDGASAWLATRAGTRELIIISDFQSSAVDSTAIALVPAGIGIRTVRMPAVGTVTVPSGAERPSIEASATDSSAARLAWTALGEPFPGTTSSKVLLTYGGSAADGTAATQEPIDIAWMRAMIIGLQRDAVLREAAFPVKATDTVKGQTPIARNAMGKDVVVAERIGDRLRFSVRADPASLTSVALNRALLRLMNPPVPASELDTTGIADAALAAWQREARPVAGQQRNQSDGRWFWVAALVLLGVESWMRSRQRGARDQGAYAAPPPAERAA